VEYCPIKDIVSRSKFIYLSFAIASNFLNVAFSLHASFPEITDNRQLMVLKFF